MGGCGCGCGPGPEGADSTPCHLLLLLLRVRASPSPAVAPCPTFLLTGERTLRDEDIAEDIAPVGHLLVVKKTILEIVAVET